MYFRLSYLYSDMEGVVTTLLPNGYRQLEWRLVDP